MSFSTLHTPFRLSRWERYLCASSSSLILTEPLLAGDGCSFVTLRFGSCTSTGHRDVRGCQAGVSHHHKCKISFLLSTLYSPPDFKNGLTRSGTHRAVSVVEDRAGDSATLWRPVSITQTYFGAPLYVIFHTPHSISFIWVGKLSVRFFFLTYTNPNPNPRTDRAVNRATGR